MLEKKISKKVCLLDKEAKPDLSCKLWSALELFGNEHRNGIWQNTVPPNSDNISAFSCQVQTSLSSFHFSVQNVCLSYVYLIF